jgi:tetratricopeptide (TPR) repeat protein
MKRTVLLTMLFLGVAACAFAQTGKVGPADAREEYDRLVAEGDHLTRTGKYVEAVHTYDRAALLYPSEPTAHIRRGMVQIGIWRFPDARMSLTRALELDPSNVEAKIWMGRVEIYDLEYARSLEFLKTALDRAPGDPRALSILSLLLIHLDDLDRSVEASEQALAQNPDLVFARVCRAHVHLLRKETKTAAREFARCLKTNRWSAASYVGLAQSLSQMERLAEAHKVLNAGLKRNPHIPSLYTTRAFIRHKQKRVRETVRDYNRALAIDSEYAGGHHVYSYYAGTERESAWPRGSARDALRTALRAMEAGDPGRALDRARAACEASPKNVFALLVQGAAAHALEEYETVLACARKALALDPKAPLPHVLFVVGRSLKQEMKKLELAEDDFYAKFRALPVSEIPGIERVFVNFSSLSPDGRKVVLRAAAPFVEYFPALEKAGVFHYVLPLYRHLTHVDAMNPWKGKPTFDGRQYDAVRGAAGKTAVTGVETLWPSTRMGPNIIAHEFAHQVHHHALNGADKSAVTRLFRAAKKHGRCLDFYAGENESEYFAQGYEAYISPFKRPTGSETGKNTRDDLKKKDPDLFRFFEKITGGRGASPGGK